MPPGLFLKQICAHILFLGFEGTAFILTTVLVMFPACALPGMPPGNLNK